MLCSMLDFLQQGQSEGARQYVLLRKFSLLLACSLMRRVLPLEI